MTTEVLADNLRQLIVVLVSHDLMRIRYDPAMQTHVEECEDIISMLSGTDTRVVVERAYPSKAYLRAHAATKHEVLTAAFVFFKGSEAQVDAWLNQPAAALNDAAPLALLDSHDGCVKLLDYLTSLARRDVLGR